jgi:hypothetical protein
VPGLIGESRGGITAAVTLEEIESDGAVREAF